MDRAVDAFSNEDAWRLAALSTMGADELRALFSGRDAAPWVTAAANSGLADAQVRLGRMLLAGEGVARDESAACAWFARAAEQDHAEGHNMLGRCLENGWGAVTDLPEAAKNYAIAAQAGDAWAQYNLGHCYLDGLGLPRDLATAFVWYFRAANLGHARAMNLVARCYEEGWGIKRDITLARAWYRKSAEGGYFRGAYNYATMLAAEGCIVGAAHWFESALASAPPPTRAIMAETLAKSPHAALRALGLGMGAQVGITSGLI